MTYIFSFTHERQLKVYIVRVVKGQKREDQENKMQEKKKKNYFLQTKDFKQDPHGTKKGENRRKIK